MNTAVVYTAQYSNLPLQVDGFLATTAFYIEKMIQLNLLMRPSQSFKFFSHSQCGTRMYVQGEMI